MSLISFVWGMVSVGLADYFFHYFERMRERKREDSKRGWVHQVKVSEVKISFKVRKCFGVVRVAYPHVSIPVLGRYRG